MISLERNVKRSIAYTASERLEASQYTVNAVHIQSGAANSFAIVRNSDSIDGRADRSNVIVSDSVPSMTSAVDFEITEGQVLVIDGNFTLTNGAALTVNGTLILIEGFIVGSYAVGETGELLFAASTDFSKTGTDVTVLINAAPGEYSYEIVSAPDIILEKGVMLISNYAGATTEYDASTEKTIYYDGQ